ASLLEAKIPEEHKLIANGLIISWENIKEAAAIAGGDLREAGVSPATVADADVDVGKGVPGVSPATN
nr:hypothetical protein [Tanacetum cinerariifolium]